MAGTFDERPVYQFTMESLAKDGSDRAEVEEFFEGWIDRLDQGDTYDDLMDRLEASPWEVDGVWHSLDLGTSTDSPVYKRLLNIARQVRREMKA